MSEQAPMPGEFIYEQIAHVTQITEYGLAFDKLVSGTAPPPAEGARFDAVVEGTATGPKLNGVVKGVDYVHVRADGRIALHYHAEITTEDDKKIALEADGVLTLEPGSPIAQLRNNVALTRVRGLTCATTTAVTHRPSDQGRLKSTTLARHESSHAATPGGGSLATHAGPCAAARRRRGCGSLPALTAI